MYWGICIVFRIYQVCLVWLETVVAECIGLCRHVCLCNARVITRISGNSVITCILDVRMLTPDFYPFIFILLETISALK